MRSLSSILLPRLKEGDASKDLASGIAAQVTFEASLVPSWLCFRLSVTEPRMIGNAVFRLPVALSAYDG